MFQFSKKVEYGLIAIQHMARERNGRIHTTKEIADKFQLPYDLLAKVMQKLAKHGFIESYQGVHGGYILARNPYELKLSEIMNAIEGKANVTIIQCESENTERCLIHGTCTIKNPLTKLQVNINKMLDELTIMEMAS